jgi:hypothetical protein
MTTDTLHGKALYAKKAELYAKLNAEYLVTPTAYTQRAFDIAWEARNNYADIAVVYTNIVILLNDATADTHKQAYGEGYEAGLDDSAELAAGVDA